MRTRTDRIRLKLAEKIHSACAEAIPLNDIYDQLVEPPNLELGDLAFGCFALAKLLRKGPPQIAAELKSKISALPLDPGFLLDDVQAVGPYLNFRLSTSVFGQELLSPIQSGKFFQQKLSTDNPKTMIEFSQPNTHKELHVGHMRNACLGDAVVKVMRRAGFEVISSTFPGDVGTHVAKCLWYMKFHNQEPVPATGKGEWLGRIYSKAHLKLEDEEKTPQGELNKKQLTEILHQLEAKQGEYFEQWKETRKWSIELMNDAYAWAGIQFDHWYWESEVDSPSVQYVKELYEKGKLQKSEGAIGVDLSADNLGFCLLLKSDGTGLYATKDLELAKRKFLDFKIDRSIYVVDQRQALHFKQVFKVLEILGFSQAKDCFHLQYNFVELPDGAMSSRKGNIVPLMKLVHEMENMVRTKYLSRYENEWDKKELDLVSSQVAQGAIKYGMVKIDNNKKIVFDMAEWLKIDGDSGPFIQYSAARINSLCRKLGYQKEKQVDWTLLSHKSERNIMQALLNYHTVIVQAAETYRPSVLCTYLYDLAKRFNVFYHDCSIGLADTPELKDARLALSYCTGEVLRQGLALIGIPTPERM
jgi:arginyl-tRNA synthetase